MTTLLYDGSFEGLLTAVFEVYEYRIKDFEIITEWNYTQTNFFEEVRTVTTNPEKAARILRKLEKSIGKNGIRQLLMVYFSEKPSLERLIYSAVRHTVTHPDKNILEDFADSDMLEIAKTVKSVGREVHRMYAFVRFEKLQDETFYAVIEPDFNVLPMIIRHFRERYKDQKWMIFDAKRNYGIFWNLLETDYFFPEPEQIHQLKSPGTLHHEEEKNYQKMWHRYFVKTGFGARRNMKLHTQWMPKRYWKYLTEKVQP